MTSRSKHPRDIFEVEIDGETLVVISLRADDPTHLVELSPAEYAVACDALAGLSNREIAHKRGRAVRTVANQLAKVYRKLGVGSRAELAALFASG